MHTVHNWQKIAVGSMSQMILTNFLFSQVLLLNFLDTMESSSSYPCQWVSHSFRLEIAIASTELASLLDTTASPTTEPCW